MAEPTGSTSTKRLLLVVLITVVITVGITALLVNIFERKQEARNPFYKVVELDDNTAEHLREYIPWAREEYVRVWGVEMGPEDLLFPDWDAPEPSTPVSLVKVEADMVAAMEQVGFDPAFIYAYQQTGRLVTEENMGLLLEEDLREWTDAVERYRSLHGDR